MIKYQLHQTSENILVINALVIRVYIKGILGIKNTMLSWIFMQHSSMFFINTLRPIQNGRQIPDDIFKYIFLNENVSISITISLKFAPKGPIENIPALVEIMAWHCPGDKPLSEPMMVCVLMHICITRPQWVNKVSNRNKTNNLILS